MGIPRATHRVALISMLTLGLAAPLARALETESALPAVITAGVEAYRAEGAQAALNAWLKGGPLEGEKQAQSQAGALIQIEAFYGKFQRAHSLGTFAPSLNTTLVYLQLDYEKGPVFGKFLTYKPGEKETIVQLTFHTDPDQVLPSQLLLKAK